MTGQYAHTIDAKGRLFIPAALRKELGQTFHILVDDDVVFLRSLRYQLAGAPDAAAFLREHYGHLDEARRRQLAAYYADADGMALQSPLTLGDIAHWVEQALEATRQGA